MGLILRQTGKIVLLVAIWMFIMKIHSEMPKTNLILSAILIAATVFLFRCCGIVSEDGICADDISEGFMFAFIGAISTFLLWVALFIIAFFTKYNDWELFNYLVILMAAILEIRIILV